MSTQIPTNTQQNTSININNSSSNILDILNLIIDHYKDNSKIKIDINFNPSHF